MDIAPLGLKDLVKLGVAKLPSRLRAQMLLDTMGLFRIPLILWLNPRVEALEPGRVVLRLPFHRRNRNHMNCMYFGALCSAADLAAGVVALTECQAMDAPPHFLIKSARIEFLKRAEGDTLFSCSVGDSLAGVIRQSLDTNTRVSTTLTVTATVPSQFGREPVATFEFVASYRP